MKLVSFAVGEIRKMHGGYDGDLDIVVTAVGLQNVLYVNLPLVYFNGALEEHKMRLDKFEEKSYSITAGEMKNEKIKKNSKSQQGTCETLPGHG